MGFGPIRTPSYLLGYNPNSKDYFPFLKSRHGNHRSKSNRRKGSKNEDSD
ncbi:MAG: hypothetical protein MJ252_19650 [archaeon]|nr:hypothetical protein [archaeon]